MFLGIFALLMGTMVLVSIALLWSALWVILTEEFSWFEVMKSSSLHHHRIQTTLYIQGHLFHNIFFPLAEEGHQAKF